MIQCARCAAANQPSSKYCLTCGAPLPAASAVPTGAPAHRSAAPQALPPAAQPPAWGPPGYGPPPDPGAGHPQPGYAQPSHPGAYAPQPYPAPGGAPGPAHAPPGAYGPPHPQAAPGAYPAPMPMPGGYPQAQPAPAPGYGSPSAHGSVPPYGAAAPYPAPQYSPAPYAPPPAPLAEPSFPRGPSRPPSVGSGRDPDSVEVNAPRVLAGFLVSYDGLELGGFWPIYQGQNQLGRRGAAPGLDIEIDHPTTSSRHAVLYASARPARLKLEDAGSTNGTFLGEQQLERGRRVEVQDGDSIRFGGFATIVKLV